MTLSPISARCQNTAIASEMQRLLYPRNTVVLSNTVITSTSVILAVVDQINRTVGYPQVEMSSDAPEHQRNLCRLISDRGTVKIRFPLIDPNILSSFSVTSSVFRTSINGYCFSVRVCYTMNPSNSRPTWLSIFFALHQGDYDPILTYPFPFRIFFNLVDQTGQSQHVMRFIIPNPNRPAFQRPTTPRGPEEGIVDFCPLHHLTDANSLFVRWGSFDVIVYLDFLN